jgi:phage terminase large subunit-like protein
MNADLSTIPRKQKLELVQLLAEQQRRKKAMRYLTTFHSFYDWQLEFVAATARYHECCLCAANQIGKTYLGTDIDAMHLLGEYPDDWPGHRFDFAPMCWGLGYSMEKTRDLLQKALFGEIINQEFTGGLVPKDRIISYQSASGTPNAARTVRVKHKAGTAVMQFWSYTQGQHAIMGDVVDWVHVDEEPKDQTIRPQLLTRTINGDNRKGGRIIYTFTPENGRTDLVLKFMDDPSPSQFFMKKGWADAPHMTEEKCERLLAQFPAHQRDMRSKGEPMLGHGRIYDIAEEFITCDIIRDIPNHWYVINGMDFGWDHPQAHVRLYHDRDADIIYLAKAWKGRQVSANDAYGVVKEWGPAPVAWPHDGLQHEKGRDDAVQQKQHYAKAGFNMIFTHACWPDVGEQKGGNSVEQGIYEIAERMRLGKFKVFNGLIDFQNEFRQYHRDEHGKIVKTSDDILDAVRYAYMMRRFAARVGDIAVPQKPRMPQPIGIMGQRR